MASTLYPTPTLCPISGAPAMQQPTGGLRREIISPGVGGPYVLAGHSFGGLYVRIFAAHYPDEVAGLVLIDSTASQEPAETVIPSTAGENSDDGVSRVSVLGSLAARVGLARLYGDLAGGTLPTRNEDQLAADAAQANTVRSVVEEYLRGGDAMHEAASLRDLRDKPLVVLTAGAGNDESWMTAQNKTTTLSTNSVHRVIDGATHQAMLDEKQYADDTTRAVLDVLASIRHNQPLTTDH